MRGGKQNVETDILHSSFTQETTPQINSSPFHSIQSLLCRYLQISLCFNHQLDIKNTSDNNILVTDHNNNEMDPLQWENTFLELLCKVHKTRNSIFLSLNSFTALHTALQWMFGLKQTMEKMANGITLKVQMACISTRLQLLLFVDLKCKYYIFIWFLAWIV